MSSKTKILFLYFLGWRETFFNIGLTALWQGILTNYGTRRHTASRVTLILSPARAGLRGRSIAWRLKGRNFFGCVKPIASWRWSHWMQVTGSFWFPEPVRKDVTNFFHKNYFYGLTWTTKQSIIFLSYGTTKIHIRKRQAKRHMALLPSQRSHLPRRKKLFDFRG